MRPALAHRRRSRSRSPRAAATATASGGAAAGDRAAAAQRDAGAGGRAPRRSASASSRPRCSPTSASATSASTGPASSSPYDTTRVRFERELVDDWLSAGASAPASSRSSRSATRACTRRSCRASREFRAAFRAFRERYPDVQRLRAVERDQPRQPADGALAAARGGVLQRRQGGVRGLHGARRRRARPGAGWRATSSSYRRHLDGEPAIWGLHNYADTNRFRDSGLRDLLAAVPGEVWLTETGGIVQFGRSFPRDERRAARAVALRAQARARQRARQARLPLQLDRRRARRALRRRPDRARRDRAPAYDALREALSEYAAQPRPGRAP